MTEQTKTCRHCKIEQPIHKFTLVKKNKDGHSASCNKCKLKNRHAHTKKLVDTIYDPSLDPSNLEEFIERQQRLQIIAQRIQVLTTLIGRAGGVLRNETRKKQLRTAKKLHTTLTDERNALRAEVMAYEKAAPVPIIFFSPRVVDDNHTVHTFKKLKTLSTACNQRNKLVDKLLDSNDLTPDSHQTATVKVGDFQTTTSQRMATKKTNMLNTNTKC